MLIESEISSGIGSVLITMINTKMVEYGCLGIVDDWSSSLVLVHRSISMVVYINWMDLSYIG